jgi:putative ABC transport system substrate-binding protein
VGAASRGRVDIDRALAKFDDEKAEAILVLNDSVLFNDASVRARIIEFAGSRRLPSASTALSWPKHGGLLGLGADQAFLRKRAADYVRRIIEGELPSDLPVQRPAKLQLSINLLTARAIGITIPPLVLGRADEVIE